MDTEDIKVKIIYKDEEMFKNIFFDYIVEFLVDNIETIGGSHGPREGNL